MRHPRTTDLGCYPYVGVVFMIERLMNPERPYGEPEYSNLGTQITRLKQQLSGRLDRQGMNCLEQLTDLYTRQETAVLRDAFTDRRLLVGGGANAGISAQTSISKATYTSSGIGGLLTRFRNRFQQTLQRLVNRSLILHVQLFQS